MEYRVRGLGLRTDMTASSFNPRALLADARLGVLATIKSSGIPQLSPVTPFYDQAADVVYVSMTEGRAKTANLRRDPRAALEVTSADGWAWATAEGTVTLTGPGTDPQSPEVEALVDYYRSAAGEHPDWDEYRSVMVSFLIDRSMSPLTAREAAMPIGPNSGAPPRSIFSLNSHPFGSGLTVMFSAYLVPPTPSPAIPISFGGSNSLTVQVTRLRMPLAPATPTMVLPTVSSSGRSLRQP
jgi:PPOX class probable F420-dependent enzyme